VAGVNISSLYQYFPNKEAILAAVYAAKLRAEAEGIVSRAPVLAKVANQSLEDALRALIQSYVDPQRRFSHLNAEFYGKYHHVFDLRTGANEEALAHGQLSFDEWFLTVLKRHRARLRVADLKLASFLVTRTLEGVFRLAVEERPDLLDSPAFQEELLALLLGYLEAGRA
jgi:AcrR family transcriptional regulator